jgi:hypothetical protein
MFDLENTFRCADATVKFWAGNPIPFTFPVCMFIRPNRQFLFGLPLNLAPKRIGASNPMRREKKGLMVA